MIESSPVTSQVEANTLPLDHEIPPIKEYILLCKQNLNTLDEEIEQIKAAIDAQQLERNTLNESINHHRGYISPFRQNLDIMREIFLHCLSEEHDSLMSVNEAPMLLTHVCRDWRDLALATPSLWSSIFISAPTLYISSRPTRPDLLSREWTRRMGELLLQAVDAWLARSGSCPLSITVYDCSEDGCEGTGTPFFSKILPYCARWKRLVIHGEDKKLSIFDALNESDVPLLEDVVVSFQPPNAWAPQPERTSWTKFGLFGAAGLKRLCLRMSRTDPAALPIRWDGLTHLSIEAPRHKSYNFDITHTLDTLRRCANLISIQIKVEPRHHETNLRLPEPVVLSQLLHLAVHINSEHDVPSFFNALHAPSLRELTFLGSTLNVGVQSILNLLSSVPSLKRLTLEMASSTSEQIESIFLACPLLVAMRTSAHDAFGTNAAWDTRGVEGATTHATFDLPLLQQLTPSSDTEGNYLLPYLTELDVKNAKFTPQDLVGFVLAREKRADASAGTLPKMKRLRIRFDEYYGDTTEQLKRLPDHLDIHCAGPEEEYDKPYNIRQAFEYEMHLYPRLSRTAESSQAEGVDYRMFSIEADHHE